MNRIKKRWGTKLAVVLSGTLLLFGAAAPSFAVSQETLSVNDYLLEVMNKHQGYRGSALIQEGSMERSVEGRLFFSPSLFSEIGHTDDQRPTQMAIFTGTETKADAYSVGLSQETQIGLKGSLSYDVLRTDISGAESLFVPEPRLFENRTTLELSQALWRNAFGRSARANETSINSRAKATSYAESFKQKQILADAESNYWRLAIFREIVKVAEESLDRAQKIRDYTQKRVSQNLIDRTDLFQSEAALKARELDLKISKHGARQAARTFNTERGIDSDEVSVGLSLPTREDLEERIQIKRAKLRDDVKAARETKDANIASSEVSRDQYLPSLELFANASLNGLDPSFADSADDSFGSRNPYYTVGVRVSTPLDQAGVSSVRTGYLKEAEGARKNYERKLFEQESQWKDLQQSIEEAKDRLETATALEEAQKEKLTNEKESLSRGRSTTFQVLSFEQDYLLSQVARLRTEAELLSLAAQLRTFTGDES